PHRRDGYWRIAPKEMEKAIDRNTRLVSLAYSKFDLLPGAARYELAGSLPNCGGVSVHAALKYIHRLWIDNIRAHAKELTDRLQKEIPKLGYTPITPPDNPTPIVSFLTPNYRETGAKLDKAFGETVIAMRRWEFTGK